MKPREPITHTRRYIEALYVPDELLCLTMLDGDGCGKLTIGYYRDREKFCYDAQRLNGRGNVYVNLHRIHPDLYGRAADRFKTWSKRRYTGEEVIWRLKRFL